MSDEELLKLIERNNDIYTKKEIIGFLYSEINRLANIKINNIKDGIEYHSRIKECYELIEDVKNYRKRV